MPCELATDACTFYFNLAMHFSKLLKGWIPNIVKSDKNVAIEEQDLLPELKRCVITTNGKLTPNFEYIKDLREKNEMQDKTVVKKTEEKKGEIGATASVLHQNVSIVKPKKEDKKVLDFSEDQ